jgi:hypothetical protein
MNRIIALSVCTLIGLGIGWYFGFTRPAAENQRKLLLEFKKEREGFQLTEQRDEFAAAIALGVLKKLEQGDLETARKRLHTTISTYYRAHRDDGNTNYLVPIERFAATNEALSNAIYGKLKW